MDRLGAAAAVTNTLGVGTYVLNTGVRDPVRIAAEAATLNLLAPGRVHLGLGAGHTPEEWTQIGLTRPAAAARVQRLAETLEGLPRCSPGRSSPTTVSTCTWSRRGCRTYRPPPPAPPPCA